MKKILVLFIVLILTGCVADPPKASEYINIPPLENGLGRIYISGGVKSGVKLWSVHQVGPVFINEQRVGAVGKNEYIAVDLFPGIYEAHWVAYEPEKLYIQKTAITIKAGETKYFTCDLENRAGMAFGVIGVAVSDYLQNALLTEQSSLDSDGKLVSYLKFDNSQSSSQPLKTESVVNKSTVYSSPNTPNAATSSTTNSSTAQKLRELDSLRNDGVITEADYQKKKAELLEKY